MKTKWVIITAVVVTTLIITAAISLRTERDVTTRSEQAYNYYLSGVENMERLYNAEAIEYFESAVQLDSAFASAWANLGYLYKAMGRSEEGKLAAKRANNLSVDLPEKERLNITLLTAESLKDKEIFEAALELMLERYPREFEPHYYKASSLWGQGKLEEAIEEFKIALEINPNFALAYNSLGYIHAQLGFYDEAIVFLKKYIFIAPDQANPHDSLGEIYLMVGRYIDALEQFRQAIAVKPTLAVEPNNLGSAIYIHMARALKGVGKINDADEKLSKAEDLAVGSWKKREVLFERAWMYAGQKSYDQALLALDKADKLKSYDHYIALIRSNIYYELDNPSKLAEILEEDTKQLNADILKCLGGSGDITEEQIAEHLENCKYCETNKRHNDYIKVFAHLQADDYAEALKCLKSLKEKAVFSISKNWIQYLITKTYVEMEEYQLALKSVEPLLVVNPYNAELILLKAKALTHLGERESALKIVEDFIAASDNADPDWSKREEAIALRSEITDMALQ